MNRRVTITNLRDDWASDEKALAKRSGKSVCVIRYGAFGDIIMAAPIFQALKDQGYDHICANVTERGSKIVWSDPNINEILFQKTNQVPITECDQYWEALGRAFDKVINLSGVIEGGLIPSGERVQEIDGTRVMMPAHPNYLLSDDERRQKLNRNYVEASFERAEIPFSRKYAPRFYPTKNERKAAEKTVRGHRAVVWALSGSSVHKAYPWTDAVIAQVLMATKDVHFYLVGDDYCRILEAGWESEERVHALSGEMDIRDTLALAQQADVVVGPETGVLNAVSAEPMRKIVFMSHSSTENLTKHWRNTLTMTPEDVGCYPCHRLHHGFRDCNQDSHTKAAMCAARINPSLVSEDIIKTLYGAPGVRFVA